MIVHSHPTENMKEATDGAVLTQPKQRDFILKNGSFRQRLVRQTPGLSVFYVCEIRGSSS